MWVNKRPLQYFIVTELYNNPGWSYIRHLWSEIFEISYPNGSTTRCGWNYNGCWKKVTPILSSATIRVRNFKNSDQRFWLAEVEKLSPGFIKLSAFNIIIVIFLLFSRSHRTKRSCSQKLTPLSFFTSFYTIYWLRDTVTNFPSARC